MSIHGVELDVVGVERTMTGDADDFGDLEMALGKGVSGIRVEVEKTTM
jgi:hypothetical protein